MIAAPREFARALASAFVADMVRAPTLERAVHGRKVGTIQLRNMIYRDLAREARGEPGVPLFPNMRAFVRTYMNVEEARRAGGMSEWAELASAITGAASNYVAARTEAKTATSLAKLDLEKQRLALRATELEAAAGRLEAARAEGFPRAAVGLPDLSKWILPGLALLVVGGTAIAMTARR